MAAGEAYEKSENPGYSEAMELKYKAEDKKRFFAAQKVLHDKEFEAKAAELVEEFKKLSPEDKVKLQDKYADALVNTRIEQAKEAGKRWLFMQEKEFQRKSKALENPPYH